jgi:hypothetical protein
MDNFTAKANSIIKNLREEKEEIVYSSEEENAEDPMRQIANDPQMKQMGLDPAAIAAVNVANAMNAKAAKSGVPGFRKNPEAELGKAYGKLMTSIATKINNIAGRIK